VTVYLIDENVLRELHSKGNREVRTWYASVAQADLRISAMTFFEKRRGWERRRKSNPDLAAAKLAELNALEAAYGSRLIPIDGPVAAEWARLLGAKDKNQRDRALAATARVHGFVLVTRNMDDMRGCDVKVLNPFRPNPVVETV
jgi:toxin FitB